MRTALKICAAAWMAAAAYGQATMTAEMKAKVEAKAAQLRAWGTDPVVVAAVKAHNASPSAEAQAMTNEKWKTLSVLDPFVRSFSKNPAARLLKEKKDALVSEGFVSGADGTKVAFLTKPSSWTHGTSDKHKVPMKGKTWIGPVEVDGSSGIQQVQVAVPVLDGRKPIGSIVFGLMVSKMR